MAATLTAPTLADLLKAVRSMLGQKDSDNSTWSNDDLTEWLNEGTRRYFQEVVQNSEGHFEDEADLDVVAGSDLVALPSDFFEAVRVFRKVGENDFHIMEYNATRNQDYTTQGPNSETGDMTYHFRENSLVLRDVPQYSQTGGIRVEYIKSPEMMLVGADSLNSNVAPIFKDLIVAYAIYKAKLAQSIRGHGVDLDSKAQAYLGDLYSQFKDVVESRSHYPNFIHSFNPEER